MAVILRRLLGIGRLPDDMRAEVDAEGIIHVAEFVSVIMRFTGSVPGRRSAGLVRGYVGALALTNKRVLGTLSTLPKKVGRVIDQPWAASAGTMVTANLDGTGLTLDLPDVSVVDPQFKGAITMWRVPAE
jgi:hypothetical protein